MNGAAKAVGVGAGVALLAYLFLRKGGIKATGAEATTKYKTDPATGLCMRKVPNGIVNGKLVYRIEEEPDGTLCGQGGTFLDALGGIVDNIKNAAASVVPGFTPTVEKKTTDAGGDWSGVAESASAGASLSSFGDAFKGGIAGGTFRQMFGAPPPEDA